MRGTPNEFFSFLPEQEQTAAIQAFAIIRRCDDALRFEALVGSWLVARLISILRMDSSAIITTTVPAVDNNNLSNGNNNQSVSNGSSGGGGPIQNDGKKKNMAAADGTAAGTIIRRTVCTDKPLFMYVGHIQSSGAAMNGFATHLAGIISAFSTTKGTSTTVASTISYCLNLLEHSKHKVRLLNGLCSIIIHSHPSMNNNNDNNNGNGGNIDDRGLIIPDKARQDLKRILTTALCCILLQVKTSCEAVQDFDYIWEACRDKAAGISSVFEDYQTSKECAWLFSIGSYLSEGDNISHSLSHADRRRVRLLFSGACISIVAQSALWLGQQRRRRKTSNCGQKFSEIDAIAKLCSLGKTNSTTTAATTATINSITATEKEGDTSSLKQENSSSTNLLDIIVGAINELSPSNNSISKDGLLEELQKGAIVAAKLKLLDDHDQNYLEPTLKSSGPLKSMFSTHHDRILSINLLTNYCRLLLNSSQNSHSPNGPSIFTGFSFVDETLLVAQSTSYVRLYLIDFNERKNATAVEHVAAEVQFYKKGKTKTEPSIESEDDEDCDSDGDDHTHSRSNTHSHLTLFNKRNDVEFQGEKKDVLELNTWTSRLLESSAKRIKPSTKLLYYIGSSNAKRAFSANQETVGQIMIPSINKALERLLQTEKDSKDIIGVDQTGGMEANKQDNGNSSKISLKAKTIGRAMLSLYYDSIESILDYETARLKTTSHRNLLLSSSFHKALLSVCLICVVHGTSGSSSNFQKDTFRSGCHLFVQSILTLMDCTSYEYMKVSESFVQSMENSSKSAYNKICKLPTLLQQKIRDTEDQIFECLLWTKCPTNIDRMRTAIGVIEHLISIGGGNRTLWPPKVLEPIQGQEFLHDLEDNNTPTDAESLVGDLSSESNYINYLITKVMSLVSKRVSILCEHIGIPCHDPIIRKVWYTFRQVLSKKCHLLYGQHIDQVLLCTIYGVGKVVKYSPELTFSKIIGVYKNSFQKRLGKEGAQQILHCVTLNNNKQGTVVDFYNQIYLPSMKKHLLNSKRIKTPMLPNEENKKRPSEKMENISGPSSIKRSRGMIKLQDSNLHVNVMYDTSKPKKDSPKSRVFYSFGDASSVKNLDLINKTINYC